MINKNFALLWMGKIISQLGDKFYAIALAWWILQKTNSPSIMGFFLFVSVFPSILLGIFAGAFVDRWKRRNILIVTDILRGALVLIISCLAMNNVLEVWHVFVIAFCLSIATAFFDPAVQSILPEIVDKDDLNKANGMNQMVGGVCTVAGPLCGAMAVSLFGMDTVFLVNSISYFISALMACFIIVNKDYRIINGESQVINENDRHSGGHKKIWNDIREGVQFLKGRTSITLVLKIIAAAHFFLGSLMVLLPFLAKGLDGNGIRNLGYLEMMLGAGLISGAILIGILGKKSIAAEQKLISFMLVVGLCFGVMSLLQFCGIHVVYAYLAVMIVIGIGISFASVTWQSLLQSNTPVHIAGRVFSISSLVGNVSLPAAYCIFGMLLKLSSIRVVLAGCGVCLVVLCCCLFLGKVWKGRAEIEANQVIGQERQ